MSRHLNNHLMRSKIKRKRIDMIIAPGEWVEVPHWSGPKEPADRHEPETPPPLCDSENNEKVLFYYEGLKQGKGTPWVDQRFGQIAVEKYHQVYGKNPKIKHYRSVKSAWTEFEAWIREKEGESDQPEPDTKDVAVQTLVDEPRWNEITREATHIDDILGWYVKTCTSIYQDQLAYARFEKIQYCRECPHCKELDAKKAAANWHKFKNPHCRCGHPYADRRLWF